MFFFIYAPTENAGPHVKLDNTISQLVDGMLQPFFIF
jgi:hypothetical protein